jgi:hypothetical protein
MLLTNINTLVHTFLSSGKHIPSEYQSLQLRSYRAGTAGAVVLHVLLQNGWTVNPHKLAAQKSPQGWFSLGGFGDIIGFIIVGGVIASDDWYYTMVRGPSHSTNYIC